MTVLTDIYKKPLYRIFYIFLIYFFRAAEGRAEKYIEFSIYFLKKYIDFSIYISDFRAEGAKKIKNHEIYNFLYIFRAEGAKKNQKPSNIYRIFYIFFKKIYRKFYIFLKYILGSVA